MKPLIVIVAALVAAAALPLFALLGVRRAWRTAQKERITGGPAVGKRAVVFAMFMLRRSGERRIRVVEGGRLFCERYDAPNDEIALCREVYAGGSLAAFARAALAVGNTLLIRENARPSVRLARWNSILRILVNTAPLLLVAIIALPGGIAKLGPLLAIFGILLAAAQMLTYPAARAAGERAIALISSNTRLSDDDLPKFKNAIRTAAQSHLAAPLLESFWLRWLC
jgi:Zn-dependent membrane protease YugP